ncbi:hypothetical protein PVAP13_3NG095220 [Panicum virgatum]|uniref:Uncharacterized protein n=1 Tax=Panicum virgatum TaxID=38727 RepID=A0A8T0UCI5_PANVG|nr:hypothetical protein PVAP13_3NG095220 [Panicum virgatum]
MKDGGDMAISPCHKKVFFSLFVASAGVGVWWSRGMRSGFLSSHPTPGASLVPHLLLQLGELAVAVPSQRRPPYSSDDEASSGSNITSRCSPKSVFSVVSKFSKFKNQIIQDYGFGGILEIPCISKLNLKQSVWLLSKLDNEESCLVFGPSRRIYVHEDDVGIVLGIPSGEIDVSSTSVTDEQLDLLRSSIGLADSEPRSIKGIEYVLGKHLDDQSSSQEIDGFKVAFVVFVICHLLAPCVKHDHVNLDFWGALKNPGSLDRYNWCLYVYGHVLVPAQKV